MDKTGLEEYYVRKDGKKLRFGYTTGTCAAAAAKAATYFLLTGICPERVYIRTPKGIELTLRPLNASCDGETAVCAIKKQSGDDPDVTDGILVYASVKKSSGDISIDGGIGIGRITKPGLKRPVGEAAINPAPLEQIRIAVREVLDETGEECGIDVVISAPEGVEIAKKTFNPNLGIEGGISILGTSGIVEPMSEDALTDSIELEIKQKKALGARQLILTPGNYGEDFIRERLYVDAIHVVKCSNYIGKSLDYAINESISDVLIVGHIGKLIKLTGGIMNTHSREGDCRAELMASCVLRAGGDADLARSMFDCVTTDEMLKRLEKAGFLESTMKALSERIDYSLKNRVKGQINVSAAVFSDVYGMLCKTDGADDMLAKMSKKQ